MQGHGRLKITWKFVTAVVIYVAFAIYLFAPYFNSLSKWQYLWPINFCIASIGCYILSRRWVAEFAGSFFAGAIYGFGPFTLGLAHFHPLTGLLAAAVPWLFFPAAFGLQGKWQRLNVIFTTIPYIVIILFFQATSAAHLFVASTQAKLKLSELYSLIAPLVAVKRGTALIGFYHVPIAALVMGTAMLIKARRYSIMAIIISGIVLVFCDSLNSRLAISPIFWFAIPTLCFSVIIGAGFQGLASSGFADRKWILANAIVLGSLTIITLLLATKYFQIFLSLADGYARLFIDAAKMYLLGAIVLAICFFMTLAKARLHPIREIIISITLALDIFISAQYIIDKLF